MTDAYTLKTFALTGEAASVSRASSWPRWPNYGLVDDLLSVIEAWQATGLRVALATLVDIVGSSPRPLGSEMAVNEHGEVAGYVSGGCVEAAVAAQALEVLKTGSPVMLDYGAGSPVLDVQLTCGGRIGIFVHALADDDSLVRRWRSARKDRRALTVQIDLQNGRHRYESTCGGTRHPVFSQQYLPPPRVVVVGSDPITLALCQLAPGFGFEVQLLRPYGPSAPPEHTMLVGYDNRPLVRALSALRLDAHTAVFTLTHEMTDDHVVLETALRADVFAAGALGSRRKSAEREARLRSAGISDHALSRLHSPAGLDIGAQRPREIALAMLAQVVALRPRARVG